MDSDLQKVIARNERDCERTKKLKAFDDTKTGVKGLVDQRISSIPEIFVMPQEEIFYEKSDPDQFKIPVIDLKDMHKNSVRRKEIVETIKYAPETWGFFQVLNHGIPQDIMDEMIIGISRFNEQANEMKMEFYSREEDKKVRFYSNFDLYKTKAATWRDTLFYVAAPNPPCPEEYPATCREVIIQYSEHCRRLGQSVFELLSEALGLNPNHLTEMLCAERRTFVCYYYPACPEPDRTLRHAKHCDPDFLTILLQDQIGGLQILHENNWVDVPPMPGAIIVNVGELLQLISNDKFKSVEHRLLANRSGPRISVACFFTTHFEASDKLYGPIKELLSSDEPPLYRETLIKDYINAFYSAGLGGLSILANLRL